MALRTKTRRSKTQRKRGGSKKISFANTSRVREFNESGFENVGNAVTKPNRSGNGQGISSAVPKPSLMQYPYAAEDSRIIGELFDKFDTYEAMIKATEATLCVDLNDAERDIYESIKDIILDNVKVQMMIVRSRSNPDEAKARRTRNKLVVFFTKNAITDFYTRMDIPAEIKPNILTRLRCNMMVFQLKVLLQD